MPQLNTVSAALKVLSLTSAVFNTEAGATELIRGYDTFTNTQI
jgi:hypothetical protein